MKIIRACATALLVMLLTLAVQQIYPSRFRAPLIALAHAYLFGMGDEMLPHIAWPLVSLVYLAPSFVCGLLAGMMMLAYDYARSIRQRHAE